MPAEVSLHRSGTGGFSCGVTRKPDSTASVLPGYSEKTRELVKGRKGRPGQWGRQREEDGPRDMRKESGPGGEAWSRDCGPGPCPWSPLMDLWILQTADAVGSGDLVLPR